MKAVLLALGWTAVGVGALLVAFGFLLALVVPPVWWCCKDAWLSFSELAERHRRERDASEHRNVVAVSVNDQAALRTWLGGGSRAGTWRH